MAGLKTCACGEPTFGTECEMCATDKGLFQSPTRPAPPILMTSDKTLRDEFAIAALPACIAHGGTPERYARQSYEIADAMLEARNANR